MVRFFVAPAKAGAQGSEAGASDGWIPAVAGMTIKIA
jgi:hypothetical protein